MGQKSKTVKRVVLDTNIILSALLFGGKLSRIVRLWQEGKFIPLLSRETFEEIKTALAYPKFSLSEGEIRALITKEILPFFEVIDLVKEAKGVCRDPGDDKFISCALSGSANLIVSGDRDLCELKKYEGVRIIKAIDFLKIFD